MNTMAVALAKDVLKHLDRFIPQSGTFLSISGTVGPNEIELELRDYMKDKTCNVCALGSLFLAYANIYNHVPVKDLTDSYDLKYEGYSHITLGIKDIQDKLKEVFSESQLRLIEIAYELGRGHFRFNPVETKVRSARETRRRIW